MMNTAKNKKTKYVTAIVVFIILSAVNIYFSVMLHKIFSKAPDALRFDTLLSSIDMIIHIKGARVIFLTFELFIILGLAAAQITRVNSYQSDLIKITEDIYIPKEVGEKQYGSARFYTKDELNKVFTIVKISKSSPNIAELMAHGYDDLEFIK